MASKSQRWTASRSTRGRKEAARRGNPMLRFTIRELVLVTVIVAMGLAWWLDRRQMKGALAKQNHQLYVLRIDVAERENILNAVDKEWKEYLKRW